MACSGCTISEHYVFMKDPWCNIDSLILNLWIKTCHC